MAKSHKTCMEQAEIIDKTYQYDYCTRLDFEGVTSWYQSRLPVGHPLPTPWSKLSLVIGKTILLTLMCGLSAHVAKKN